MSENAEVVSKRDWPRLSAAVLAGGKSSRMGQDKALLSARADGVPMLAVVLARLSDVADEVLIVDNDATRYAQFGARIVPDLNPGGGALLGIQSAIAHAENEHCLVVACDMPYLNADLLARMAREPRDYDVLVPELPGESRQRGDGRVFQTLHAIYGKGCAPAIQLRVDEGLYQVVGFFSDVRVRTLSLLDIAPWDPGSRSFFNANTPEALEQARSMPVQTEPLPWS